MSARPRDPRLPPKLVSAVTWIVRPRRVNVAPIESTDDTGPLRVTWAERITAMLIAGRGAFGALSADFNTAKTIEPGVIEERLPATPFSPRIFAAETSRVTNPPASETMEPLTPVTSPPTVLPRTAPASGTGTTRPRL